MQTPSIVTHIRDNIYRVVSELHFRYAWKFPSKDPIMFPDFNQKWNLSTNLSVIPQYQISLKFCGSCYIRPHGYGEDESLTELSPS
jgi:hypothetical protein